MATGIELQNSKNETKRHLKTNGRLNAKPNASIKRKNLTAALGGFGFLLAVVVTVLHARERRADKLEQLAVANRFHFDAM